MEAEVGTAPLHARFVALSVCFVTRTTTAGDAASCLPLPREVRDSRTRMVIRVGNVDEVVRRVNRDLEKVGKAAVGAASQAAGGDRPHVVGVVAGLAQRESRRA